MARIIENPRKLILDSASKILYHEGYSNLSIRRVAKECGIAVGTIYNYFPTKKALIVEMMTEFWKQCFYDINLILNSSEGFYIKLKRIFDGLSRFIKRFKDVWLKKELYSSPDYIESGLERENIYINKLIDIIEEMLNYEVDNNYSKSSVSPIDTNKMASFIVMNFITMIQMPQFDYEFFESVLKRII